MAEYEDRTEQATPRRRQKAREEGKLAHSRELVSMSALAGVLAVFYLGGEAFMNKTAGLTRALLELRYGRDPLTVLRAASMEMLLILIPFFAAAAIFGTASSVLQGGLAFKPLTMELERMSPLAGFRNLFSVSALPGILKSFFKFVVGIVLFIVLVKAILPSLPETTAMDLQGIRTTTFALMRRTTNWAFLTFFSLALADYAYERWKFDRSLRMSKDEVREEARESEGDPLIKAKIKSVQKELARRRMMEAVPRAAVVITNPTHIAVALEYRKDEPSAPKVVAKGKGYIAEAIRDLARKHGIPIVEDKPLARALFKVKLDRFIPEDLYRAVAKILAYIYKLKGVA
jgi:flagellar biosynthesis protein FlhB